MNVFTRRSFVAVAAIASGVLGFGVVTAAAESARSASPVAFDANGMSQELRCPTNEPIFSAIYEIQPVSDEGSPSSPEEAVEAVVSARYPRLDRAKLRTQAREQGRARIDLVEGGARRVAFGVIQDEQGWYVEALAACNGTLLTAVDR